jgi:type II secretory pathway pseudopilin PulG
MNVRKNETKPASRLSVHDAVPHFGPLPLSWSARPSAFTLVELMVSIAVMVLILGIMLQISSGTLLATKGVSQKMEAGEGARAVLATLGADLANLGSSQGLTVYVNSATGVGTNSELAFITQSRGPSASNRFISVDYQLSALGQLSRYTQGLAWTDQNLASDTIGTATATTPTFSVLAQGILSFAAVAVLDNGTIQNLAANSVTANSVWNNSILDSSGNATSWLGMNLTDRGTSYNTTTAQIIYTRNRVRAVIVGVVSVDSKNYTLLTNSGKLATTEGYFVSSATGQTPMDAWEPVLYNGSLNGIPKPVVSAIQVFQSTYPLY